MKDNHRGRKRAYVAVRLKITNQAFPSGPPNIAALVQVANTRREVGGQACAPWPAVARFPAGRRLP